MTRKPILVIMAAGLGSRFGGLKQITPVDREGQLIIDYSIFDAISAGFERVICIIKPELERDFDERIANRLRKKIDLRYAYQTTDHLPDGFHVPDGRTKPWGTAHAVLCAKEQIDAPFCVINADDFYGRSAFQSIARFLIQDADEHSYAMIGYRIENTLTENGSVARGVCTVDEHDRLLSVTERTRIFPHPDGAVFAEDDMPETILPTGTYVSMNMWGFHPSILAEIEYRFTPWLNNHLTGNPLKCEYYLPLIPNQLIQEGKATISVLPTHDKWYGVTYADDLPQVQQALSQMRAEGMYPRLLWE